MKKILSMFLALCMAVTLLPVLARAAPATSVMLSGDAPAITTQPVDAAVTAGGAASFTVGAAGTGLTYQWQVDTGSGSGFANIVNGGVYSGVTTETLTITGVNAGMTGYRYHVVVNGADTLSAVSNPATLTVITKYDIWVGGVQVTSENKGGITGDGIDGRVTYDSDTNILTLNGATITGAYVAYLGSANASCGIYAAQSLNLVLQGENTVTAPDYDNGHSYAVGVSQSLALSGGGTLNATGGNVDAYSRASRGLYAAWGMTIESCTVTATGGTSKQVSDGIWFSGGITINGSTVIANGGSSENASRGIYGTGAININGGTLTSTGGEAKYSSHGILGDTSANITIDNSTVTAGGGRVTTSSSGCTSYGIYTYQNNITIKGGSVVTAIGGTTQIGTSNGICNSTYATNPTKMILEGQPTVVAKGGSRAVTFPVDTTGYTSGTVAIRGGTEAGETAVISAVASQQYVEIGRGVAITYIPGGDEVSGGTVEDKGIIGLQYKLSDAIFSRDGYTQTGWATTDGGTHAYALGASHTVTAPIALYPVWTPSAPNTYTVTATAGTGGSISPSGNVSVDSGESQTFTITPNSNYSIADVKVDGVSQGKITSYTFADVAANHTIDTTFTYNGDSGGGSTTPAPGTPITLDGKTVNIGTEKKSGDTTTVTVDQPKLGERISGAAAGSSVVVPVTANSAATASLVVRNIEDMAEKGMTLTVQTGSVAYNLNAAAIDTAALEAAFPGADMSRVPFDVTIQNSSVSVEGETLVLAPVAFTVTASYNGQTVSVDTFSSYIDRVIEVTAAQAAKITTAVVVNADGSTRHVPTSVIEKGGKYYAIINSRTNSVYALIENEVSFADAAGKWYEAAVNEMGGRKIISGRSAELFDGEAGITRAEFSAILVRAMGLPADGTSSFSDVSASAWYTGAIATAVQYGLTEGKGNNRFEPDAQITRQEAMLMLQRTAALTTFTGSSGGLDSFADGDSVGTWAIDAAKWSVGSGLIQGAGGKLNPTSNITRAESATIILRLLQKADLVDVRSEV